MGYAHNHFLSSETRSLMTIRQLTVDQVKAKTMIIILTNPGKTELRIETISPNIDNGMRQYPMTLIHWNNDLNFT